MINMYIYKHLLLYRCTTIMHINGWCSLVTFHDEVLASSHRGIGDRCSTGCREAPDRRSWSRSAGGAVSNLRDFAWLDSWVCCFLGCWAAKNSWWKSVARTLGEQWIKGYQIINAYTCLWKITNLNRWINCFYVPCPIAMSNYQRDNIWIIWKPSSPINLDTTI